MADVLTPEKVMEIGEQWRRRIIETATPDEIVASMSAAQRQALAERLVGLDPTGLVASMSATQRRALLHLLQEEADGGAGEADESNREAQ